MLDTSRPASRILTVLELLQDHPGITGPQLADRLEVSGRTVRRYITTLQDMGVPVEPTTGRLGGYALRAGFRLPPMMFSAEEALGLAVALLATRPTENAALPQEVASALAKIERVLPPELNERIESIRQSVVIPSSADALPTESFPDPGILAQLAQAHLMRRRTWFRYGRPDGDETAREVDPYGIVSIYGRWYLHGWCYLRRATRTFRIDRIRRVDILPQTFVLPEDLDVIEAVQNSLALSWSEHMVEVHVDAPINVVRENTPTNLLVLEEMPGNRTRLRSSTSSLDWFAWRLAQIPFPMTIIEPDELRDVFLHHAAHLQAIVDRNPVESPAQG
jgi:predicted DNA-binding transcriptional regulator YafY